ncbi:MAG: hypothetical protein ACR2N4_09135 [Jatrophihabitans sp.]
MTAYIAYAFGLLEPGESTGIFLHGFDPNQAVAIDVQARRTTSHPGAFIPSVEVDSHVCGEHVDRTLFHTITVHNVSVSTGAAPLPYVTIAVIEENLS